jgi:hypothetical protein
VLSHWKQASHIGHCSRCAATKDEDKVRFLKEAAIMAQFNHPNIVGLVGVCTLPPTEPTLIVLEYMHLGSLHGYLQSPMVKDQLETLTMLRMALDVAARCSTSPRPALWCVGVSELARPVMPAHLVACCIRADPPRIPSDPRSTAILPRVTFCWTRP